MRVTNEQIRAEIVCTQGDTCEGCPFYCVDNCDNLRGNDFDMYKDLLEAREIIKEMRTALKDLVGRMDVEGEDAVASFNKAESILERTREYAE